MNRRKTVRYTAEHFPASMSKVTALWDDGSSTELSVVDYSVNGMGVRFESEQIGSNVPKKQDTIRIFSQTDRMYLTGMCAYTANLHDRSECVGVYFYNTN